MNKEDSTSILEAIKDTMEVYCSEAGVDSNMRVFTENNGMYIVNSTHLLKSIKSCDDMDGFITIITGIDPVGREYPVSLPFKEVRLILDDNDLIAYETDADYFDRIK